MIAAQSSHLASGDRSLEGGMVLHRISSFVFFFIVLQVRRPLRVHVKLTLTGSGKISSANRVPASKVIELLHTIC